MYNKRSAGFQKRKKKKTKSSVAQLRCVASVSQRLKATLMLSLKTFPRCSTQTRRCRRCENPTTARFSTNPVEREREKKRWSGRRRGGERAALQHVDQLQFFPEILHALSMLRDYRLEVGERKSLTMTELCNSCRKTAFSRMH